MFKKALEYYYTKFRSNKYIIKFGTLVSAENLWHLHRESVARASALGVACSWIPLPFHTIFAVVLAVVFDCNIPLAAVVIWIANPITMPFMYYYAYKIGASILGVEMVNIHFHVTIHDLLHVLHIIWQPFLLGCLICALASGLITYFAIHLLLPNINGKFKF